MTLQRYLTGLADSRVSWPIGLRRWRPGVDRPMTLGAFGVQVAWVTGCGLLLGLVGVGLLQFGPLAGGWWPVPLLTSLGLVLGLWVQTLITVAWNRRAAALRAAGPTVGPVPAKRRWWETWLVGPMYTAVLLGATPVALWGALDNVAGTLSWQRERSVLKARGEPVTFAELMPPRPPDEQNFAMTPLFRPLFDFSLVVSNARTDIVWRDPVGRRRLEAIGFPPQVFPAGYEPRKSTNDGRLHLDSYARGIRKQPVRYLGGRTGISTELAQRYGLAPGESAPHPRPVELPVELELRYGIVRTNPPSMPEEEARSLVIKDPAAEVLAYLRRFEPELREVAEAVERQFSQFPLRWDEGMSILLGHLSHGKRFSTLFRVRAAARLAKGDAAGAYADTVVTWRLAEKTAPDPLVISVLVRIAQTAIATGAVWEGLAARQWSDPQLATLQDALLGADFREAGLAALRGERVLGNGMYEQMLARPGAARETLPPEDAEGFPTVGFPGIRPMGLFAPRGLLRRNQVHHNRLLDSLIGRLATGDWSQVAWLGGTSALLHEAGLRPTTPYNVMAVMLAPALEKVGGKLARQQVTTRLAAVACALERHRLRHGTFPAALSDLAPEWFAEVPSDPMNAQPFSYERTADGWFRLWSVGLNGRDDGGIMTARDNDQQGDWVWPVPVPRPGAEPRLF